MKPPHARAMERREEPSAFGAGGFGLCTLDSGTADSPDDLGCVGGKTVSLNAVFGD